MKLRTSRRHEVGASNANVSNDHQSDYQSLRKLNATESIYNRKASSSLHVARTASALKSSNSTTEKDSTHQFDSANAQNPLEKKLRIQSASISSTPSSHLVQQLQCRSTSYAENQHAAAFTVSKQSIGSTNKPFIVAAQNSNHFERHLLPQQIAKKQKNEVENHLIERKHNENQQSEIETQLVHLRENNATRQGWFNASKVDEIRLALKRQYQGRANFKRIFNEWDQSHSGRVDAKSVTDALSRMGIACNAAEAQLLIASADHDRSNDLNLAEFIELISNSAAPTTRAGSAYRQMRSQSVNAAGKQSATRVHFMEDESLLASAVKKEHARIAEKKETTKSEDVKQLLKNKLYILQTGFVVKDRNETGFVDRKVFEDTLRRRADIPVASISETDLQEIFYTYSNRDTEIERFDYRAFVKSLKANLPEKPQVNDDIESYCELNRFDARMRVASANYDRKTQQISSNISNDIRKDNPAHIDAMKRRADRVFFQIRKRFTNQEEFAEFLARSTKPGENQILSSNTPDGRIIISKEKLHSTLVELLEDAPSSNQSPLEKAADISGAMHMFVFNNENMANLSEIAPIIFTEREKELYTRIGQRIRGPPPQKFDQILIDSERVNTPQLVASQNASSQNNQLRPNSELHSAGGIGAVSSCRSSDGLKQVLRKVEHKLFVGGVKAFDVFKSFDNDRDGYIKEGDLVDRLKGLAVLDADETRAFYSYLDPTSKGYIDFSEFSTKVHANMSNVNDACIFDYTPMNKFQLTTNRINASKTQSALSRSSKDNSFTATKFDGRMFDENIGPKKSLSFLQATSGTGMFASEADRFSSNKLDFQQAEARKKKQYEKTRLGNLRVSQNIIEARKHEQQVKAEARESANLDAFALQKQRYEDSAAAASASSRNRLFGF